MSDNRWRTVTPRSLAATYLVPGVVYGHTALKQAFFAACDAGMWCVEADEHYREGVAFTQAVYYLWENGEIEMTETKIQGATVDFFKAVITARHDIARPIEGYLTLVERDQ